MTTVYEKEMEPIGVQHVSAVKTTLNRETTFSKVLITKGAKGRIGTK